jgi:tripartite-type tricarboxylate transporter receptor subunit TctC
MKLNPRWKIRILIFSLFSLLVCWEGFARAEYPDRPINLTIGFSAGSSTDALARPLAEAASKFLGQPIIVHNKPGASTGVALVQTKNDKPDGYNIGYITGSSILNPHLQKIGYDVNKDYTPIIKYVQYMMGLAVRSDSPWKTMNDLIAWSKANPGKFKYSHSGVGTVNNMAMESFAKEAGLKWGNVAYKGGAEGLAAILGKHVDGFASGVDWKPYVDTGELRLLVTFNPQRSKMFPDVPTFLDLGYKTWLSSFGAFIGPKGLPANVVDKLHNAFNEGMKNAEFLRVAKNMNYEVAYSGPEALAKDIKDLDDQFARFVKEFQLKKD